MYATSLHYSAIGTDIVVYNQDTNKVQIGERQLSKEEKKLITGPLESEITVDGIVLSAGLKSVVKNIAEQNDLDPYAGYPQVNNRDWKKLLEVLRSYNMAAGISDALYLIYESDYDILIVNEYSLEKNYTKQDGDQRQTEEVYTGLNSGTYADWKKLLNILSEKYVYQGRIDEVTWCLSCEKSLSSNFPMTYAELVDQHIDTVRIDYQGDLKVLQYSRTEKAYTAKNIFIIAQLEKIKK